MFDIPECNMDTCTSACRTHYEEQCGQDDSKLDAMCMAADGVSHIFNQYTTLGALILAFIAMTIFRI